MSVLVVFGLCSAITGTKSKVEVTPATTKYASVYNYSNGSAVAIAPNILLTAKHLDVGPVTVGKKKFSIVREIASDEFDLRMIWVKEKLPTYASFVQGAKVGQTSYLVGYGDSGRVHENGNHYTTVVRDRRDVRRAAPINLDGRISNASGPLLLGMFKRFGEGTVGSGDSGGGWFINGKLAGIILLSINASIDSSGKAKLPWGGLPKLNNGIPYIGTAALDLTNPEVKKWVLRTMKS